MIADFSDVRGQTLLIALSGGADSTALTCLLCEARDRLGLTLYAAYVDHGIRGAQSAADGEYCRKLCEKLGVGFFTERFDVPAEAKAHGEGLETAARRVRYAYLEALREKLHADRIVLAHHADDRAETVLMHIFRGCGPDGLTGLRRFSERLYRPLLDVRKEELVAYLNENGIHWRTDATNAVADNPRNALRLNILPEVKRFYPAADRAVLRLSTLAEKENAFLDSLASQAARDHVEHGPYGMRVTDAADIDEVLLRRILRKELTETSYEEIERILSLVRAGKGKSGLSQAQSAEMCGKNLYLLPKVPPSFPEQPLEDHMPFPGFGTLTRVPSPPVPVKNDPLRQVLKVEALEGAAVRTRRTGDRIRPFGAPGDRLLSDYLTDKKIDRPLRDTLPLLAVGSRVLWVIGVGIAQEAALDPDTKEAVLLTWIPFYENEIR